MDGWPTAGGAVMQEAAALLTLFAVAFGSASLLPGGSEPLLSSLLLAGASAPWLLWLVASLGNTLGSVLNWWLGRHALRWRHRRWFPLTPARLELAGERFRHYGLWSLLFAWLPVVGDPLTLAAGLLRVPLLPFVVLVGLGKGARYALLTWLFG